MHRIFTFKLLAFISCCLLTTSANGQFYQNNYDPIAALQLGTSFSGVHTSSSGPAGGINFLTVAQPGQIPGHDSCVQLNSDTWLTAAHNVTGLTTGTTFTIGLGNNTFSNPGVQLQVINVYVNPTYIAFGIGADAAILKTSVAVTSVPTSLGADPAAGVVVTGAGFGLYGTPATGVQPYSGDERGFTTLRSAVNASGLDPTYYADYDFGLSGQVLDAKFLTGTSGGGLFDDQGRLVGIAVASSVGNDSIGLNVAVTTASIQPWIESYTNLPPVPEFQGMLFLACLTAVMDCMWSPRQYLHALLQ